MARKISAPKAFIPPPDSKAKRNRDWEKRARVQLGQVTYRGVPNTLRDEITRIAEEHFVPAGEVARVLLEFALEAYQNGEIEIQSVLRNGKLTLFPED